MDDCIGRAISGREKQRNECELQADVPEDLYDKLITGQILADAVYLENVLNRLNGKLEKQKAAMACHPTARVWLHNII